MGQLRGTLNISVIFVSILIVGFARPSVQQFETLEVYWDSDFLVTSLLILCFRFKRTETENETKLLPDRTSSDYLYPTVLPDSRRDFNPLRKSNLH